ncbi:MAG: hypothetical protein HW421_1534 [Ignavibacteria bacterium]|nr:hypothetical protein [Ignavibacteria bacterium]
MLKVDFKQVIIPLIAGIIIIFALSISSLNSQCCSMKGHGNHSGHSGSSDHSDHSLKDAKEGDTTLIKKGKIDVYAIDTNKDGYVYQDQMHWNVISDKPGNCPICSMELEKVKNLAAIKNLKENDIDVK